MESKLQSKIKNYLKSNGWIVLKTIKLSDSGYPDLFCFKEGKTIFIEVKDGNKGVVSELQNYRIKELQNQGFEVYIIKFLNEIKKII